VDNVAQEDELGGAVLTDQCFQAVDRILRSGDRQKLARVAMSPGVAEMEIGGDNCAVLRQPEHVTGVQMKAGSQCVSVMSDDENF
jgi:hypothetical protein